MSLNLSDEYSVKFKSKPFGMTWASRKSDRKNLYVTGIDEDTPAYYNNVTIGSKLLKFGDQNIENLGAKEIFWHYKNTYNDVVPLKITFKKPLAPKTKTPTTPISSRMSIHQNFLPNPSQKIHPIKLPVDCGENAMKYSLPNRLQEMFITILEYMANSKNTQNEWVSFLSSNNYQILTRFAKTTKRLLVAENEEFEASDYKKNEEEDEDEENKSSAFGWLCVILVMFGNLNITNFVDIITEYTFKNIIISLKFHMNLSRQDCVNRLDAINWILLNNNKLTEFMDDLFIQNLCHILNNNTYNEAIELASKSLIFAVTRKRKTNVKNALVYVEDVLSDDSFRHFTEFYFDLLNNIDYDDTNDAQNNTELELLIEFNAFVFRYNLYTFYFTSDIKILIDIYLRACHNCQPSSKQLLLCLDGLYNIIRWKNYSKTDVLDKYKLDDLVDVLTNELKKTVKISYTDYHKQHENYNDNNETNKYTKSEINDILRLIQLINNKIDTIIKILHDIKHDKYDYDLIYGIELPIDISEYSLKTKSMKQLQNDLLELLYFLSQNINTPQEWITFLTENNLNVYKRLCILVIRLLKNETKYIKTNTEEKKDDDVDMECDIDNSQLYPLTILCQLLVMFATLEPPKFIKMIKLRVLNPLRASLKHSDKLNTKDIIIRLEVLLFMVNNDDTLEIAYEWFVVLCNLLSKRDDDKEDDILLIATQCITFFIGKMSDKNKQKDFLLHLQGNLKNANDFRYFIQVYIKLINEIKITRWNDATTRLLINFVICVMNQQLNEFFYISDIKILIEIYQRCITNIDIGSNRKGFVICLNGIKALFNWNMYKENDLNKYRYNEIINELKQKLQIAKENNINDLVNVINDMLSIKI